MSRTRFQDRLDGIKRPRAVARHGLQKHPKDRSFEQENDDRGAEFLLLALLGAGAAWLMVDFWRALPFVIVGAVVLGAYSIARTTYLIAHGRALRSNRNPVRDFFPDLW